MTARLPLKIELNCEIFDCSPLEHRIRMIPLNRELYELNHDKTLQQWENLRAKSFTKMVSLFHKNVQIEMDDLRREKERIAQDLEHIKQFFPDRALRDALALKARKSVLDHLLGCIVNIYAFLCMRKRYSPRYEKNKYSVYAQIHLKDAELTKKSCQVHQFPSTPEWIAYSPKMRERLFQDYKNKLNQWEAEIDELDGAIVENFKQLTLDGGARAQIQTLWGVWKKIQAEKDNFDADAWLAEMAEDDGPSSAKKMRIA